jgi:hypothetical protein
MQYQSPFKLLGITPEELNTATFNPVMLRKKLLAEFELTGKPTITVPGGELSKNDVLSLIDEIKDVKTFNYHTIIYRDEVLHEFLLSNHLDGIGVFASDPIYNDEGFLHFISPFFAHAYCEFISNCLNDKDYCKKPLQEYPLLLAPGTEYFSLEPARVQIHNYIDDINNLTNKLEQSNDERINPEIIRLFGGHVIHTLDMLPSQYFENETEEYFRSCILLIDACIKEDKRGYRNVVVVRYVVTQLERMKTPLNYYDGFQRIRNYLFGNNEKIKEDYSPNIGMIVRLIVIGIILISNIARFSSSGPDPVTTSFINENFDKIRRLQESVKRDYYFKNLIISLRSPDKIKNDSLPQYKSFHTGDNPFYYLKCSDPSPSGHSFKMTFKNDSKFEVVVLVNNRFGSSYIYISPQESYQMGTDSDSAIIAVLAGKKWIVNLHLPIVTAKSGSGMDTTYNFTGNFKEKAANYKDLLALVKYAFPSNGYGEFTIRNTANNVNIDSNYPYRKINDQEQPDDY